MLTTQQLAALSGEIANDPTGVGYAAMLPARPGHVAESLNALTTTKVKTKQVTARALLAELDPAVAATFLETLEAVSLSQSPVAPVVKWGLKFITSEPGIDIGHPHTIALIDALVAAQVLSGQIADAVKGLASQPASRAEVLLGDGVVVTFADVLAAVGV